MPLNPDKGERVFEVKKILQIQRDSDGGDSRVRSRKNNEGTKRLIEIISGNQMFMNQF